MLQQSNLEDITGKASQLPSKFKFVVAHEMNARIEQASRSWKEVKQQCDSKLEYMMAVLSDWTLIKQQQMSLKAWLAEVFHMLEVIDSTRLELEVEALEEYKSKCRVWIFLFYTVTFLINYLLPFAKLGSLKKCRHFSEFSSNFSQLIM